jgi:hypothetical protein
MPTFQRPLLEWELSRISLNHIQPPTLLSKALYWRSESGVSHSLTTYIFTGSTIVPQPWQWSFPFFIPHSPAASVPHTAALADLVVPTVAPPQLVRQYWTNAGKFLDHISLLAFISGDRPHIGWLLSAYYPPPPLTSLAPPILEDLDDDDAGGASRDIPVALAYAFTIATHSLGNSEPHLVLDVLQRNSRVWKGKMQLTRNSNPYGSWELLLLLTPFHTRTSDSMDINLVANVSGTAPMTHTTSITYKYRSCIQCSPSLIFW